MGLWNFLGGNQIGPGHPRYERELKKQNKLQELHLSNICAAVMSDGMPNAVNQLYTEAEIISVLKQFPDCPKYTYNGVTFGSLKKDAENWKQAQQWLYEKENLISEDIQYLKLEQKYKELEARIEKLEQHSYEKE